MKEHSILKIVKHTGKWVFLVLLTLILQNKLLAQEDTITYSVLKYDTLESKYDPIYRLFVADKLKDTKQLWKTNLLDVHFLLPSLAYERKIGKRFSSDTYIKVAFMELLTEDYYTFSRFSTRLYFQQSIKYYYNLNRRERLGKRATGFSGNYFSLCGYYNYLQIKDLKKNTNYLTKQYNYGVGLRYGLQRRIGNIGYIEPFVGINYFYEWSDVYWSSLTEPIKNSGYDYSISLGIYIGFAVNSIKKSKFH